MVSAFAGVVAIAVLAAGVAEPLELLVRDGMLRTLPSTPPEHTVVIAIDEISLRTIGPWPWSRPVLARLVDRLRELGARAVVLDVLLADERAGDDELAAAARRIPTIAVAVLDEHGDWLLPAPRLAPAMTSAHGHFELDHDGILRHVSATKQSASRSLSAISVESSSLVSGAPVPVGAVLSPAFLTSPGAISRIRASDLLAGKPSAMDSPIRGRVAFIGPTALALGDRVLTPSSGGIPDPGVTVHAAAAESLIRGETISRVSPLAAGAISFVLITPFLLRTTRRARILHSAATLLLLAASTLILLHRGTYLPMATIGLTYLAVAAVIELRSVSATLRRSHAAAARMEAGLGISDSESDAGPRLESIAARMDTRRDQEAEAKRRLTHELRTPLASMRGLTQLLTRFELTEAERNRVAGLLESEAGKLESMIGVMLDLERLSIRDFASSTATLDLGALVSRRVEFLRAGTDRVIHANTPAEAIPVRGDSGLLERVVDNLISNAVKYTDGEILVQLTHSSHLSVLQVEDRGTGIPSSEREKIFSRFFRASTAAGTNGLGLGLALVAEIAEWHSGVVQVMDSAAGGTIFRIELPLAAEGAA